MPSRKRAPKSAAASLHAHSPSSSPQPARWSTPYAPAIMITSPTPNATPLGSGSPNPRYSPHHRAYPTTPAPSIAIPLNYAPAPAHASPAPYWHASASPMTPQQSYAQQMAEADEAVEKAQKKRDEKKRKLKEAKENLAREEAKALREQQQQQQGSWYYPAAVATPAVAYPAALAYPQSPYAQPPPVVFSTPTPARTHTGIPGTPFAHYACSPGRTPQPQAQNVTYNVPPYSHLTVDALQGCNVFLNQSPYPTSYALATTPPAMPMEYEYGLSDPGTPEEIPFDRWEVGRTSYLYDNRSSPVELNRVTESRGGQLEINPLLDEDSPLLVDFARRKEDICMRDEPGTRWRDGEGGQGDDESDSEDEDDDEEEKKTPKTSKGTQPATLPRVTRLRLVSPKVKGTIEVMNKKGVTVNDVLSALFTHFHTPLSSPSDDARSEHESARRDAAYHTNVQHQLFGTWSPYLRRVELLMSEPIFEGLRSDPGAVWERWGERDCAMLVMEFGGREGLIEK